MGDLLTYPISLPGGTVGGQGPRPRDAHVATRGRQELTQGQPWSVHTLGAERGFTALGTSFIFLRSFWLGVLQPPGGICACLW